MKTTIKKIFITYLVIICCVYTPTAQAAGWSFGGYNFGNGSLNITKNGVKITTAAVDSAPITSNLGKKILGGAIRGANVLTALSIIVGLGEDAIDWVLDPANNAIKLKVPATGAGGVSAGDAACRTRVSQVYPNNPYIDLSKVKYAGADSAMGLNHKCVDGEGSYLTGLDGTNLANFPTHEERFIPIPTVANKIYDIAKSGNTNAQADVTSAVTELVNSGAYDTPINQAIQDAINNGTLPKDTTDTPTDPTNPQIDTSSIIAAIQSLASVFAKSLADNFNAITSVINTSIDKLLNKQEQMQGELVNVGSKV